MYTCTDILPDHIIVICEFAYMSKILSVQHHCSTSGNKIIDDYNTHNYNCTVLGLIIIIIFKITIIIRRVIN